MVRVMVPYGAIAGLIAGIPLFTLTVALNGHPTPPYGMAIGYLTMLIALSAIFAAVKRHRDSDLGGVIRFWPAFALGLGISVIAGIVYVVAWEAALAVTHADFAAQYANMQLADMKARGATADALAKASADMERFKAEYANPVVRVLMTFAEIFPIGVLVSLISAALLRNSRFLPAR